MEALLVEAARRDLAILVGLMRPVDPGLPLDDRIAALASRNAQIYEQMTPCWRAARTHEPFPAELRRSKERVNALGKAELKVVFGPELGKLTAQRRLHLTGALVGIGSRVPESQQSRGGLTSGRRS